MSGDATKTTEDEMSNQALSETGNERIKQGGNFPPYEQAKQEIKDLRDEASVWLDGAKVETQEQADTIATLLDLIRKAKKKADEARKAEKKPLDDEIKEIQARFNPLLKECDMMADTCKQAVAPFLEEQERQKREAERKAREEAEAAERAAQEAMQSTGVGDIEQREEAEKLAEAAKQADASARKASKDRGQAKGGERAMSLRTYYHPELSDLSAAIKHYWGTERAAFEKLVLELAEKDVRAGKREIPGINVIEEKKAV